MREVLTEIMGTYEIDLHGLAWRDALGDFMRLYEDVISETVVPGNAQIAVIHGYGSTGEGGILRKRFRSLLAKFEECLEFTPGEQIDGNQGCTIVRPLKGLPDSTELLSEDILDYCRTPKTRSKITGRFRRHGDTKVIEAIQSLEKQGRIRKFHKKRYTMYEAR